MSPVPDGSPWRWLPRVLAVLAILSQIAWPLTSGQARVTTTIAIVACFAAASISHACVHLSIRWGAGFAGIAIGFGFAVEALGVNTGWPFSQYSYSPALGTAVLGVPVIVPLAWAMAAYPALLIARRLGTGAGVVAIGAFALAAWDLFLDPQMTGAGYWTWSEPSPSLPGVAGVPLINSLGWLVACALLMALFTALPAVPPDAPAGVPALLWTWSWLGGIIANLFFLDRPWVALWGGLAMGIVTVPYLIRSRATRTAVWAGTA